MAKPLFSWRHAIISSDLPATTRHVLLTLSCHMTDTGDSCYPSTRTLAKETGLSERSVVSHLQIAKDRGWISVTAHGFAGKKWKRHEYVVLLPGTEAISAPKSDSDSGEEAEGTELGSASKEEKGAEGDSARPEEGTEPLSEGTEPPSSKALKEVQSNSTGNSTSNSTETSGPRSADANRGRRKRSKYKYSDDDMQLARFMYDRVLRVAPLTKEPNYERWANTIRLTREQDELSHHVIARVFAWANQHSFWSTNVMCPETLRKQIPKLSAKMEAENAEPQQHASAATGGLSTVGRASAAADRRREQVRARMQSGDGGRDDHAMGEDGSTVRGEVAAPVRGHG